MARKRQPTVPKRATLQMPRSEVKARIRKQIEAGQKLLTAYELILSGQNGMIRKYAETGQPVPEVWLGGWAERRQQLKEKKKWWSDRNVELLKRIVDTDELVNTYYYSTFEGGLLTGEESGDDIKDSIASLESIFNLLELIPESPTLARPTEAKTTASQTEVSRRVFIVHGHDEEAKHSVARCLEKLDLETIILHEQPSRGRTIIEKFEDYTDVGFAVVLLTPDDMGAAKDDINDLKLRARQNVVFELGFFIGKLGRQQVCALYKGDVEIPSDFAGVLYVPMDPEGAWRFKLVQEMKAAGLDVDSNKLFRS